MGTRESDVVLAAWLSGDNQVRLQSNECLTALAREAIDAVRPSIDAFRNGDTRWPLLLPHFAESASVWWGCAHDAAQSRELQSLLLAWVGPSWSDFVGRPAQQDTTTNRARLLFGRFGKHVYRLEVLHPADISIVSQRIGAMCSSLQRRPAVHRPDLRTGSQLRAELDRSLALGNASRVNELVALIQRTGRFSAENLQFIRVRSMAGLGHWEELYRSPDFLHLCELQLPPETYADLVEAVYNHYLAEYERSGELDNALEVARTGGFRRFATLFRSRRNASRPAVLKAFAIWELASDQPIVDVVRGLVERLSPLQLDARFRSAILRKLSTVDSNLTLAAAARALEEGRLDQAFTAYSGLPASVDSLVGLLRCARELEQADSAGVALRRLESASSELQTQVAANFEYLLERVRRCAATPQAGVLDTWAAWIDWCRVANDREAMLASLREGARSWDVGALAADRSAIDGLVSRLLDWAVTEPGFVENVYPSLYEAFIAGDETRAELRPLYSAMLSVLRVRSDLTASDLDLASNVLATCLACFPSAQHYREVVNEISGLYESVKSQWTLDWAIDVCDTLLAAPCQDVALRMDLLGRVFSNAEQFRVRLTVLQTQLLRRLGEEAGLALSELPETPRADDSEQDVLPQDVKTKIGIYSLDQQAAARAKAALASLFPSVTIEINSDLVCTERLKRLAQSAGVFAFAWKTSTHQAFYCVKDHKNAAGQLCMSAGAGSTSLVRAVHNALNVLTH